MLSIRPIMMIGMSTQMSVCSLFGGACRGSISCGTLVVGGLVGMRLLLCCRWFCSLVSGREDGGGESQWTDENSESPIRLSTRTKLGEGGID